MQIAPYKQVATITIFCWRQLNDMGATTCTGRLDNSCDHGPISVKFCGHGPIRVKLSAEKKIYTYDPWYIEKYKLLDKYVFC